MAEMTIEIRGLNKLRKKMDAATEQTVILRGLKLSGLFLVRWTRRFRLTGPRPEFLGVRSGRLRSSISVRAVRKMGDSYRASIGTNVVYARIHERGGIIRAKNQEFLTFNIPGVGFRKARSVTIPPRPFLKPAIERKDNQRRIKDIFERHIIQSMERA